MLVCIVFRALFIIQGLPRTRCIPVMHYTLGSIPSVSDIGIVVTDSHSITANTDSMEYEIVEAFTLNV